GHHQCGRGRGFEGFDNRDRYRTRQREFVGLLFPADGGTLVHIGAGTVTATTPCLGVDLASDNALAGVTLSAIAVVPEPASLDVLGIGAAAILLRRRRKQAAGPLPWITMS
ncbi:MAG: PEP-CTERM sorting domain-containing protein, partial [Tepidisphaeraceae bacterium]